MLLRAQCIGAKSHFLPAFWTASSDLTPQSHPYVPLPSPPPCSFDYILDQQAYVAVDAGKEANPEVIQAFKSHPVHKVGEAGCGAAVQSWAGESHPLQGWEGMPHVKAQVTPGLTPPCWIPHRSSLSQALAACAAMRPPVDISVGGDNDTTGVGEWRSCVLLLVMRVLGSCWMEPGLQLFLHSLHGMFTPKYQLQQPFGGDGPCPPPLPHPQQAPARPALSSAPWPPPPRDRPTLAHRPGIQAPARAQHFGARARMGGVWGRPSAPHPSPAAAAA